MEVKGKHAAGILIRKCLGIGVDDALKDKAHRPLVRRLFVLYQRQHCHTAITVQPPIAQTLHQMSRDMS